MVGEPSGFKVSLMVLIVLTFFAGGVALYLVVTSGSQTPSQTSGLMASKSEPPPSIGSLAADFTLTDLDGRSVTLSQYRGQPVLLNFWALWCPPCLDEMPSLQKMYELTGGNPVVLAVDVGDSDPQEARIFAADRGLSFPMLFDVEGRVKMLYGISRVPETFLISSDGMLAGKFVGPRDWANEATIGEIQRLLDEHR